MRTHLLRVSVMMLLGASSACASRVHSGGRPGVPPDRTRAGIPDVPGQRATASTQANVSRKRVDAKEEPSTLIAVDRSRCTVTASRFKDVQVGDDVTCSWLAGDRAP